MSSRRAHVLLAVATCAGLLMVCVIAGVTLRMLGGLQSASAPTDISDTSGTCGTLVVSAAGRLPAVTSLTGEQVRNAAIIVQVGQQLNVPSRGWVIAVATTLQESGLHNLPNLGARNDHDSLGLFQQRPSAGWGTPAQILDPAYAAGKFYSKLVTIRGWQTMALTDAAQSVQRSAYPDAYAKREPLATSVVDTLTKAAAQGALASVRCTRSVFAVAPTGWTVPVIARVTTGFRTSADPSSEGVDLAAPRGTPVHAAAAGTVIAIACDAHLKSGSSYGCDRDGSPTVTGCGWWVEIEHAGDIITRYCHLAARPDVVIGQLVNASQPIGIVGATGHATGPGLHFEVHVNGDRSAQGAVDPATFMQQLGAPLGVTS